MTGVQTCALPISARRSHQLFPNDAAVANIGDDLSVFAGKKVGIFPLGGSNGYELAEQLHALGCDVVTFQPNGYAKGWTLDRMTKWKNQDAVDWALKHQQPYPPPEPIPDILKVPEEAPPPRKAKIAPRPQFAGTDLDMVQASTIKRQRIEWLWPGRIPKGNYSVIAGQGGLGKSQLICSLVACCTTGGKWPADETRAPIGNVIILSAEDSASHTISPRLAAAGADLEKVYILKAVRPVDEGETQVRGFNLQQDLARIRAAIAEVGDVVLVVLDPITAYMGEADTHKTSDVRAVMAEVKAVAEESKSAWVGITHLNKTSTGGAYTRITGSSAFVDAARSSWLVCKDQEQPERRLFLCIKNNLGKDGSETGLAYRIETHILPEDEDNPEVETSRVVWEFDHVTMSADEAVSKIGATAENTNHVIEWLKHMLSTGSMTKKELISAGKAEGYSIAQIDGAGARLRVVSTLVGFGASKQSEWKLPDR